MCRKKEQNSLVSDFYCTECGKKGIPIPRKKGQFREKGHLKKIYCIYCEKQTNHYEVRPFDLKGLEDFKKDFQSGVFYN